MFLWASPNWLNASLAAGWGSRTPIAANTSPNAAQRKTYSNINTVNDSKFYPQKYIFRGKQEPKNIIYDARTYSFPVEYQAMFQVNLNIFLLS